MPEKGKTWSLDIINNSLVRYSFLRVIRYEFGIHISDDDIENARRAQDCIQIFDTWEDFYETTGWKRDNPECADKEYLENQKICREIGERIWHFSYIMWDGLLSNDGRVKEE